jgi:hypothetical protein
MVVFVVDSPQVMMAVERAKSFFFLSGIFEHEVERCEV